jgi:hypothetical protein
MFFDATVDALSCPRLQIKGEEWCGCVCVGGACLITRCKNRWLRVLEIDSSGQPAAGGRDRPFGVISNPPSEH